MLLGDGGQGAVWDSSASASIIAAGLRAARDPAPYTNLYCPDAGHSSLGLPPYFPYNGYGAAGDARGGKPAGRSALANEQPWNKND